MPGYPDETGTAVYEFASEHLKYLLKPEATEI